MKRKPQFRAGEMRCVHARGWSLKSARFPACLLQPEASRWGGKAKVE